MKEMNVGVLGATGAVGQEMLKILAERNFPVKSLRPLASARSAGKTILYKGEPVPIAEAKEDAFKGLEEGVKMSMKTTPGVLIVTYFFLTVAELFISPLGLSFVSKIAPRHMVGKCQGLWLTATAIGNLFIFLGVKMLNAFPQQWMTWGVFALICLASMGIMVGMLKWLERVAK